MLSTIMYPGFWFRLDVIGDNAYYNVLTRSQYIYIYIYIIITCIYSSVGSVEFVITKHSYQVYSTLCQGNFTGH